MHGWFGITLAAAVATQKLFLISWHVIIVVLTLATLRLPVAFTGQPDTESLTSPLEA